MACLQCDTGAGKSSLVSALLRLTEVKDGQILIDGRDCRTVSLPVLRRAVGVVPQTPFLFKVNIMQLRFAGFQSSQAMIEFSMHDW